jgi:tryptophanyl-tRNA synthetase
MEINQFYINNCNKEIELSTKKINQFKITPLTPSNPIERQFQLLGVWGTQNINNIVRTIETKSKFNVIIGFRPSRFHFGHFTLAREIAYYIEHGGKPIFIISDFLHEKQLSQKEKQDVFNNFIKLIRFYRHVDSDNIEVIYDMDNYRLTLLETLISNHITINKICKLYGWGASTSLKLARSASLSVSEFLFSNHYYPDLQSVVLCDINQVTHVELTKIIARKLKINLPGFSYRILLPSSLNPDERMSIRNEKGCIFVDDSAEVKDKKLRLSFTGGRKTTIEQRQLGGEPWNCCFFKYIDLFSTFEHKSQIFLDCTNGTVTCFECKNKNSSSIVEVIK